jgi:hypothetical protein
MEENNGSLSRTVPGFPVHEGTRGLAPLYILGQAPREVGGLPGPGFQDQTVPGPGAGRHMLP